MNKLDLFKPVEEEFLVRGFVVKGVDWTTPLQRHVGFRLERAGRSYFAKAAIAGEGDLDEPDMLEGLRREVWWSTGIEKVRQRNIVFPFASARVIESNTEGTLAPDDVAWVIAEYVKGQPIINWNLSSRDPWTPEQKQRFADFVRAVVRSLMALELITPATLREWGLEPLPPFLPHGCRGRLDWWNRRLPTPTRLKNAITHWCEQRARQRILANPSEYILGNGAFDVHNFFSGPGRQLFPLDNEFAGLYHYVDHLTYIFHRLWCNAVRPDLAATLLRSFFNDRYKGTSEQRQARFWRDFARRLRTRLLTGWYYDTVRRRLPPWHKKQRLRYGLRWKLLWYSASRLMK